MADEIDRVVRGIVLGLETIDVARIQIATQAEADLLARRQNVNIAPTPTLTAGGLGGGRSERARAAIQEALMSGGEVYVRVNGEQFVSIGMLTDVSVTSQSIEVTSFNDHSPRFVGGPLSLKFKGVGW